MNTTEHGENLPSNIRYLGKDEILFWHDVLIDLYGGDKGLRYEEGLDSALGAVQQMYDGHYDTIEKVAAGYAYKLSKIILS